MANQQNFNLFRGEDVELTVTLDSGEAVTGWALAFYIRTAPEASGSALVTRSTSNGGITMTAASGAAGVFTITIPASSTLLLPVGSYRYDLWRLDSGDEVMLAYGACDVLGQVRHSPL